MPSDLIFYLLGKLWGAKTTVQVIQQVLVTWDSEVVWAKTWFWFGLFYARLHLQQLLHLRVSGPSQKCYVFLLGARGLGLLTTGWWTFLTNDQTFGWLFSLLYRLLQLRRVMWFNADRVWFLTLRLDTFRLLASETLWFYWTAFLAYRIADFWQSSPT